MNDLNGIAQLMGVTPERQARVEATLVEYPITWHCPGRHGVILRVPVADVSRVVEALAWYYGGKCDRWSPVIDGWRNVEFVHMTKVFPAPTRPWGWCGETVLFNDWKKAESDAAQAARAFTPGQPVTFTHKNIVKSGYVIQANRRTVSVLVAGEGRWTVPPANLKAV